MVLSDTFAGVLAGFAHSTFQTIAFRYRVTCLRNLAFEKTGYV